MLGGPPPVLCVVVPAGLSSLVVAVGNAGPDVVRPSELVLPGVCVGLEGLLSLVVIAVLEDEYDTTPLAKKCKKS